MGMTPTEAELARLFSASRSTIARAMRELKQRSAESPAGGGTRITQQENASRCSPPSRKALRILVISRPVTAPPVGAGG